VTINADIGLAFHIDADKAPALYARFRQRNLMVLAHGYIRNEVREAINDAAAHRRRPAEDHRAVAGGRGLRRRRA